MKYIKSVLVVLLLTISLQGMAQKVKIKKGIVAIDEVEVYKLDEEGKSNTLSTNDGNEFITYIKDGFEEWKNGMRFYTTVYIVKFLSSGRELYTDLSEKDLIKAIYKSNMVGPGGKIDEEKANIFVNKYDNESLKYKIIR